MQHHALLSVCVKGVQWCCTLPEILACKYHHHCPMGCHAQGGPLLLMIICRLCCAPCPVAVLKHKLPESARLRGQVRETNPELKVKQARGAFL